MFWEGCSPCGRELPIPRGSRSCFGGSSWTQASLFNVWQAPCQTVSCKGTDGVGHWPKACPAQNLRQGCDRLDCHGDTVPPHQTCFRSMLWPDSSCPNFSCLKITSLGLVCKAEEGHEQRCLWKIALWHQLPSPLMNGRNWVGWIQVFTIGFSHLYTKVYLFELGRGKNSAAPLNLNPSDLQMTFWIQSQTWDFCPAVLFSLFLLWF